MTPAALLYFVPGAVPGAGLGAAWLDALPPELQERFRFATHRENVAGPEGRGLLLSWQSGVLLEYSTSTQDWRKIGPKLWAGIRRDYRPEEFARAELTRGTVSGYVVPLGDGRQWTIPVALADSPNYAMPWRETLDERGDIVREVAEPYRQVCAVASDLWEHTMGDGSFRMDEDRLRAACAAAIGVHYLVDLRDCLALGLLTAESYQLIVRAILDFPSFEEIARGKACAPPDTGSGGSGASAGTNPPMPTSPQS